MCSSHAASHSWFIYNGQQGTAYKAIIQVLFCNQLWKEEVSCAAKHNEASNSPAPRRSTTSEWAPFLMFLLPSSYYNYLFLSKIAPHRGPSTINGQDRESGHSQCESLCNLHSTANRNDKKSGAVSRKLILKKQFFFFQELKMLPLPALFNNFEGFFLSLLLMQSHRKIRKKLLLNCD